MASAASFRQRVAGTLLGVLVGVLPALVVAPAPMAAQDEPSPLSRLDDCCLLLLVPVGARASAMGGAIAARGGVDAMFRNPAGLGGLAGSAFVLHHSDRVVVDINAFSLLVTPSLGTVGLSYQLFDKGTITTTDPTGQPTGQLSIRDHLVMASFGAAVARSVAVGASYKLFQERVDCRGACGGAENVTTYHAVDLGYRYTPHWHPPMQLGLALVNLPVSAREEGASAFPARIHAGGAYNVLSGSRMSDMAALWLALEIQDELHRPGQFVPTAGLELDLQQVVFVRAGYTLGEGMASGAAVGLELRYDRFDIGVSRSFINSSLEEDEPFQVSFGIHF
jgi:hypothetical protein